jgi:hypothetical protein
MEEESIEITKKRFEELCAIMDMIQEALVLLGPILTTINENLDYLVDVSKLRKP